MAAASGAVSGWHVLVAVLLLLGTAVLGFLLVDWFDVDGLRAEAEDADRAGTEQLTDESS
jgi:hypothetical protein